MTAPGAAAGPSPGPRWKCGLPWRLRGWRGAGRPLFLTAEWRHLVVLTYEIDPARIAARVPPGTEIDGLRGRTFISFVGFRFLNARVLGVPIPFHGEFEQVNLRFYVRRRDGEGWRRGVVFVREIVPLPAVAFVARHLYGENCLALPMRHSIDGDSIRLRPGGSVEYAWQHRGRWNRLGARVSGDPAPPFPGSVEEFVAEHGWGYTVRRDGRTSEFQVEHPPWEIRPAASAALDCDVGALYGPEFEDAVRGRPGSAFLADGSTVVVHRAARLAAPAGPAEGAER